MKRITKIRIPKGKYCKGCKLNVAGIGGTKCAPFDMDVSRAGDNYIYRCESCLEMFPNGTVFVEQEKK